MTEDKLSIRISIADRYYPLKIVAADEERIRIAARRINEKIEQYRQRYVGRDVQDALSMATLQFVIRLIESENSENIEPLVKELDTLSAQIGAYILKEV